MSDFTEYVDLAAARLGGKALLANDDFFAPKENLLKPEPPIFIPDKYTSRGKWMDGWESRRRRTPGHDWCVIQLGLAGAIHGVDVETTHFIGNFPESCSVEAADLGGGKIAGESLRDDSIWTEILPQAKLEGNTHNLFPVKDKNRWTHLRLHIYPDGGVARLRVYGEAVPDWSKIPADSLVDLAAVECGGRVVACSDMTFSSKNNLIMPGRGKNMGDGWETKRRRGPGYDWVVIRLGAAGTIKKIEVDTAYFKGNAPGSCDLEGFTAKKPIAKKKLLDLESMAELDRVQILPRADLHPDKRHFFEKEILEMPPCAYVKFNIYPDGGVSRLRLHGVRETVHD